MSLGRDRTRLAVGAPRFLALVPAVVLASLAHATLRVEVVSGRTSTPPSVTAAQAFVAAHQRLAAGAQASGFRGRFFFPQRLELLANGQRLPFRGASRAGDLTLSFATTGATAFSPEYRTYLQGVWASAKPSIDATFGRASVSGTVKVVNDDSTISDRRAVTGGYYVPNAPGGPEIRLPVNLDPVTAAVNFVHCVLLAYQGPTPYPFDAYNEGLVRAASMAVARASGAIPGSPSSAQIESTLSNLYHADDRYDWLNQSALSAEPFIAPNLLGSPLPAGGSTGGIYLLRHQMAGSAWVKVVAEHPAFMAEFNRRYYLSPASYSTSAALEGLAQTSLNAVAGSPSATVEGKSFAEWALRQSILGCASNAGTKLLVEPTPLSPASASDFGVFDIAVHAFTTDTGGNETLVGGTSYPVYFRPDFSRFFVTAQDDVVALGNGYGSVAPNFPGATFGGAAYRVTVDIPFDGRSARVSLPAGGAFAASGLRTEVCGTLVGFPQDGSTYAVRVTWAGGDSGAVSAQNSAFSSVIGAASFDKAQPTTVTVTKGSTVVLTRKVNKGKGQMALELRAPASDTASSLNLPARLALVGLPVEPFRPSVLATTGLTAANALFARYDSVRGRFVYFPDEGEAHHGLGYFVRSFVATTPAVKGLGPGADPVVVSLRPGWNMVTNPTPSAVAVSALQVATTTQPFVTWATASGDAVGPTLFTLTADAAHPDGGTLTPTASLAPGQGVYVRCLSSQGAVLLFGAMAPPSKLGTPPLPLATGEWQSELTAKGDFFQSSSVLFGQLATGAPSPSPRRDVALPPDAGGFQLGVDGAELFYRRVFPMNVALPIRVVLRGLVPGRWVTLTAKTEGKTGLVVTLPGGATARLTGSTKVRFKATSSSIVLGVRPL